MGFLSSLGHFFVDPFTGGATGGSQFRATPADIAASNAQTNSANAGVNSTLDQQQAFYRQLLGMGGLQNQANVFNQQQGLADMLQAQARGEGPNPALDQLNQTTGQNIAAQNALMAGQRGAGANAGLLARQAAQQGGMLQQNAVGQGAVLRANQQLAAQNALANQQANMAGLATQQVNQTQGGLNSMTNAQLANQQALLNALAQWNQAKVSNQGNVNNANAGLASQGMKGQQQLFGGLMGGASSAFAAAHGGEVPHYADGGMNLGTGLGDQFAAQQVNAVNGPVSTYGKSLYQYQPMQTPALNNSPNNFTSDNSLQQGGYQMGNSLGSAFKSMFASGATNAANGMVVGEQLANQGKMVPGQAQVAGDSLKNDTVPAMLSPKEIVIPRSIALAPDAPEQAKKFVAAILAKNGMRKK
jgi:hypothetical protein